MASASKNYIPRPDAEFSAWANQYGLGVDAISRTVPIDPDRYNALKMAIDTWNTLYAEHVAAQAAAESARQQKDAARRTVESLVRPLTAYVQSYPTTTDADRATLGITVRTTARTRATGPTTAPLASVEVNNRLTHELRLVDESTPTRRGKPRGVVGAEVWVKLVDADQPAPTDPAALSFLTMTTKPSLRAEFKSGDGGKTAVYMSRWVNTRGEKGPWSEITTATVAA